MLDIAQNILTHINFYSISLLILAAVFLLCLFSAEFKKNFLFPQQIFFLIWLFFFGYHIYTGKSLYSAMSTPSQKEIEAAKYEKHMIDGRPVYYNKETGEVMKNPPQN